MTNNLADRCEVASGADRAIDYDIAHLTGGHFRNGGKAPAYTASIDAAMTLMPEGWDWFRWTPGSMVVSKPHESEKLWAVTVEASGATPALALCAAAIRALDAAAIARRDSALSDLIAADAHLIDAPVSGPLADSDGDGA